MSLIISMMTFGPGCANESLPTSASWRMPTRYDVPQPASQAVAEKAIAQINQSMRTTAYNERLYWPADIHMLVGCNFILAAHTGMAVSMLEQDFANHETTAAIALIGDAAGIHWKDYCRVINGAQGTWGRYGSGKWDAAIGKYGPTPTPSAMQHKETMTETRAEIEPLALDDLGYHQWGAETPTDADIIAGCKRLLYNQSASDLSTEEKIAADRRAWVLRDHILTAAGGCWCSQ